VLDVLARPQRRLLVALPVQLGLLVEPGHTHALGLGLHHNQLFACRLNLAFEVVRVLDVRDALLDARRLAELALALLLGGLFAQRTARCMRRGRRATAAKVGVG
jgi:hypothetical protein